MNCTGSILLASILCLTLCDNSGRAAEAKSKDKWDQAYEKLLKERPDIAEKVESGNATKEDVIAWMKEKKSGQKPGAAKYLAGKIEVKDPAEFHKGQKNIVYSGPQRGEKLPSFNVTGVRGELKGKTLNPVERAGDKPAVLILQDNGVVGRKGVYLCSPVFERFAEKSKVGLHVSTTFLVDDPQSTDLFEHDFMSEIPKLVEMGVAVDGRDGPGVYGLNRNVAMTILVAKDGKVLHNFAFVQPMLYPDAHVLGAIAEAVGEKRETVSEWFKDYAKDDK